MTGSDPQVICLAPEWAECQWSVSVKVPKGHYVYNKQLDLGYRTQERGLGWK